MKKILTHLTGIVFLITILLACACGPPVPPPAKSPKTVTIHLKVKKVDGVKHLRMHNSNKPGHKVIDTLETLVMPGDTVIWKPKTFLGRIKKLEKISPENLGEIFKENAHSIPGCIDMRFIVPVNAPIPSKREKYDIEFVDKKDSTYVIDPYLRIPKETDD